MELPTVAFFEQNHVDPADSVPPRRSRSAPRLSDPPRDGDTDPSPPSGDGDRLCYSNGCGDDSPSLWSQIPPIWQALLHTWLMFTPEVRIESWRSHIYIAVRWWPTGHHQIHSRARWHTTILRCDPHLMDANVFIGVHGPRFGAVLTSLLNALLMPYVDHTGSLGALLGPTPFGRHSLCFGIPRSVAFVLQPLRDTAQALISSVDTFAVMRPIPPFHISWN